MSTMSRKNAFHVSVNSNQDRESFQILDVPNRSILEANSLLAGSKYFKVIEIEVHKF